MIRWASPANNRTMKRYLTIGFGALSYLLFLVAFLYAIVFVGAILSTRTVDHGISGPLWQALLIDLGLLGLFGVQHSVMARPGFKRWWTRFIPSPFERSTYVLLASSVLLLLLYWQWRTVPGQVWDVRQTAARWAPWTLFWCRWAIVLASTFMINHFDLFGLRQVYLAWRGKPYSDLGFRTHLGYRLVRHPLMPGFLVARRRR